MLYAKSDSSLVSPVLVGGLSMGSIVVASATALSTSTYLWFSAEVLLVQWGYVLLGCMDSFRQRLGMAIGKLSVLTFVLLAIAMGIVLRMFKLLVWEYLVSIVSSVVYGVSSNICPQVEFRDNRVSMDINLSLSLPRLSRHYRLFLLVLELVFYRIHSLLTF